MPDKPEKRVSRRALLKLGGAAGGIIATAGCFGRILSDNEEAKESEGEGESGGGGGGNESDGEGGGGGGQDTETPGEENRTRPTEEQDENESNGGNESESSVDEGSSEPKEPEEIVEGLEASEVRLHWRASQDGGAAVNGLIKNTSGEVVDEVIVEVVFLNDAGKRLTEPKIGGGYGLEPMRHQEFEVVIHGEEYGRAVADFKYWVSTASSPNEADESD